MGRVRQCDGVCSWLDDLGGLDSFDFDCTIASVVVQPREVGRDEKKRKELLASRCFWQQMHRSVCSAFSPDNGEELLLLANDSLRKKGGFFFFFDSRKCYVKNNRQ